jgi:UPF0716 family protein affecting phage T7 exclusion
MTIFAAKKWLILLGVGAIDFVLAIVLMFCLNDYSGLLLFVFIVEIVVALVFGIILLNRYAKDFVAYYFAIKKGENVTFAASVKALLFLLGYFLAMPGPLSFLLGLILLLPPTRAQIARFLTARYTRAEAVIIDVALGGDSEEGELK